MAALPYMQLYVAEYLADTQHLTLEEHGAYLLLIMNYWQRGKALVDCNKRLSCVCRIPQERWLLIRPSLEEFFEVHDGLWWHGRIEKDLASININPRGKALPSGESLENYRGYVYFVSGPGSPEIKVGYSRNPWARISELRKEYGPDMSVVATIKTVEKSEVGVHKILAEYHSHGEWFHPHPVVNGIISLIKAKKITTVGEIVVAVAELRSSATATTNTDTDTDTDTEKKKEKRFTAVSFLLEAGAERQLAEDWLKVRKTKKLASTKTAFDGFLKEVSISGKTINEILTICCEVGWGGFKAEWLNNYYAKGAQQQPRLTGRQAYMVEVGNMLEELEDRKNGINPAPGTGILDAPCLSLP